LKFNNKSLLASSFLHILSLPVLANMFTPNPSFSVPYKPYQFNSQYEFTFF